jgi:hypothetical protein
VITTWITWNNRAINTKNLSHQHLSNIYYYTTYILPEYYPQSVRDDINNLLQERFKGVILPYKPDPDFKEEKIYLLRKGFLKNNDEIVVNGIKLGEYCSVN